MARAEGRAAATCEDEGFEAILDRLGHHALLARILAPAVLDHRLVDREELNVLGGCLPRIDEEALHLIHLPVAIGGVELLASCLHRRRPIVWAGEVEVGEDELEAVAGELLLDHLLPHPLGVPVVVEIGQLHEGHEHRDRKEDAHLLEGWLAVAAGDIALVRLGPVDAEQARLPQSLLEDQVDDGIREPGLMKVERLWIGRQS